MQSKVDLSLFLLPFLPIIIIISIITISFFLWPPGWLCLGWPLPPSLPNSTSPFCPPRDLQPVLLPLDSHFSSAYNLVLIMSLSPFHGWKIVQCLQKCSSWKWPLRPPQSPSLCALLLNPCVSTSMFFPIPFPLRENSCLAPVNAAAAKSLQSCPTLCDPIDGNPPAPPSLGFSRQEHWSGLPVSSPMHACMLSRYSHVRLCVTP